MKKREAIAEEMRLIKVEGISEDELAIAKEQMKSSYVFLKRTLTTECMLTVNIHCCFPPPADHPEIWTESMEWIWMPE